MSEMKSFIVLYDGKFIRAYKESEADKVIAKLQSELEAKELEVANLKEDALNTDKARKQWLQLARKQANEILYNKYKRCLAMAEMCNAMYDKEDANVNGCGASWEYTSKEMKFWERWSKRWLEIAEKFKETK